MNIAKYPLESLGCTRTRPTTGHVTFERGGELPLLHNRVETPSALENSSRFKAIEINCVVV